MENHLLLIGYYGLADGYKAYGEYFKTHFSSVSFFPLIELRDRLNENNPKYSLTHITQIVRGTFTDKKLYSNKLMVNNGSAPIKYVIICHNNDLLKNERKGEFMRFLTELKNTNNIKLIQINWDTCLTDMQNHAPIVKCFDLSFNSDPTYIKHFSNCCFFKAGYNKTTTFRDTVNNDYYKCDVSFIGTNLYTDNMFENKTICRKHVLDAIYADKSIKLHVYGSANFQGLYPDSYRGFVPYKDCYKVFSGSKMCLNISMVYDRSDGGNNHYYSERLPQIFGCESIAISNNDYGDFLRKDVDYVHVSCIEEVVPKIKRYLLNEGGKYDEMKKEVVGKKIMFEYEGIVKEMADRILEL